MDSVSYTALTPLSFLERSARVWPDKVAVVYGARRLTYRELAAEAQRVAGALQASGVEPGDRVAYLMPNLPEMLIAHYAVPLAGGVLVAVNTRLTAEEVAYILDHSGAKIVVIDAALLPTAAAAAKDIEAVAELVIAEDAELEPGGADLTDEPRLVSYSEFLARGTQEPLPWSVPDELAPIAINYTSGTTGRPRGVIYTHRGAYLNCFGEIVHSRNDENSVYLWTLPMFHCNGWCTPWSLTAIGGTHVCLREVRGDAIWQQLREHGVTHLNAAPTVVSTILNAREAGPLARPVLITTAGAPPSPATIAHMERMGFQIVHVYGLTETYGPISVCQSQPQWADLPAEQRAVLQARQGVGMIQAEGLRVVDDEMADVPADGNSMGEIVMRGNNVMAGYYLDPQATAEAFRGGWFHSGDLGVMHPDGYIELRDRSKDVVISRRRKHLHHRSRASAHEPPCRTRCGGYRRARRQVGRAPQGVRPAPRRPERDPARADRPRTHQDCPLQSPPRHRFVADLPKTSTGKIQKFVLRDAERPDAPTAYKNSPVSTERPVSLAAATGQAR